MKAKRYNLGRNVGDKFTKLSKIEKCYTVDFLHFLPKIWILGGWLGTRHQIQAFQRFS